MDLLSLKCKALYPGLLGPLQAGSSRSGIHVLLLSSFFILLQPRCSFGFSVMSGVPLPLNPPSSPLPLAEAFFFKGSRWLSQLLLQDLILLRLLFQRQFLWLSPFSLSYFPFLFFAHFSFFLIHTFIHYWVIHSLSLLNDTTELRRCILIYNKNEIYNNRGKAMENTRQSTGVMVLIFIKDGDYGISQK